MQWRGDMEPIQWVFIGVGAWMLIMGLMIYGNHRFHEWQNGRMKALFPKYRGRHL